MLIDIYQINNNERCSICDKHTELMFRIVKNAQIKKFICSNCFVEEHLTYKNNNNINETKINFNTFIIKGCTNCPMCSMNDMSDGYSCKLREHPDDYIKRSNKTFQPITPKWCLIKENNILFKFEK